MKKICLILSLFFTSLFSGTCQINNAYNYASCDDGKCYVPTTEYWKQTRSSNPGSYGNSQWLHLGNDPYPSLWASNEYSNLDGIAYYAKEVSCNVPYKECQENATKDENGNCVCNPGYVPDSSGEICCGKPSLDKSNIQPDWINLNIGDSSTCMKFLSDTQRNGTWIDNQTQCSANPNVGVEYGECWGSTNSPCEVVNNPESTRPNGYIYKGKVDFESDCSSYVDYKSYSKSSTAPVDSDCASNNQLYCYLLPVDEEQRNSTPPSDNTPPPSDGIPSNDSGETIPYNPAVNDDGYNLTTAPLNEILAQMQKDYAENSQFHTWVKNQAGNWVPQTQDNSNLVGAQDDTTKAINAQTDILGEKLDTINQSIKDLNNTGQTVDLNETNDLLNKILTGDGYDLNSTDSSTVLGYINDTVDSLKTDVTTIQSNFNDLISTLQGNDFENFFSGSRGFSDTCPITKDFSTENGVLTQVTIDYCKEVSPLREYFYSVAFLGFSFGFLYLGFKLLILLGV